MIRGRRTRGMRLAQLVYLLARYRGRLKQGSETRYVVTPIAIGGQASSGRPRLSRIPFHSFRKFVSYKNHPLSFSQPFGRASAFYSDSLSAARP
ncbi:hypothetical protein RIF29_45488 [Crotalaria pallida]|uniref:Uncharacterized protein n=1 Tax=Crotalaria pallida TaxID=3830 RepID=A0AAN9HL87_CROPI